MSLVPLTRKSAVRYADLHDIKPSLASHLIGANKLIMTVQERSPDYTAEEIAEIVSRIKTLRIRWLCSVNARLASHQETQWLAFTPDRGEPSGTHSSSGN
jgi:hypothetical protein